MSVSNYNPFECTYRIDKLDNVVYLIPEAALRNIKIDNGYAYVENIEYEPIYFNCYNISLEDTDTLDERYEFTHTLKFSVNGYVNHNDFQGCYYVIVKSVDNEYWLVNPLFPCKITYTYTLGYQDNHTDFTLSTVSNHPTLRIHNMNQGRPYHCNGYLLNGIDRLFLNEKMFSSHSGKNVYYTNSGFKEVIYDKKSATFQEQFDGDNVSHSVQFNIKFDDYKSSWHYNLLEFQDNLYAAIITTTKGEYVLCGFGFGLQPSYTVASDGEMTPDHIEIRLVDMHDNGDLFTFITGGTISPNNDRVYNYTTKYDAWECVSDGYAKYLLQEEFDVLGNPTGHYKCLEGYEERFAFLGDALIGTFDEVVTFYQPQCKASGCTLSTSLPSTVKMFGGQCIRFSVRADSDWSITNNASYLTFTPTSGEANTNYTVEMCNFRPQSAETVTTSFTINYCSTAQTYSVVINKGDGCFYGGDEIHISPIGQYVIIPTECCIESALETTSALTNIQIFDTYIKVYVPQNNTDSERTFTLVATLCDGNESEVKIIQANAYTRWVKEGTTCLGKLKCDVERMYSGTTSGDINTRTEVVRTTNCIQSADCGGSSTRWIDTEETVCYNGRKYIVQAEQVKPSTDSDWINTGNKRRGSETSDSPAECSGTTYEEWRVVEGEYICDGTTKYRKLRLYTSTDNINWVATDTYKKGEVIEYNSTDCGYSPTGETYYEWRIEGTQCNGYDLYNWERKYISNDGNTWTPTEVYRYGSLIEANSSQCGYVPPIQYEYQWSATTGYVCSGTNKMTREIYQRRISGSSDPWENVVPTQERAAQPMIESASTDCGYVPPIEPMYKWVTMSINQDYVCDECPTPQYRTLTTATTCIGVDKYELDEYQVSYDSGTTWTTTATSATTLIEANSEDCGYAPQNYKVKYKTISDDEYTVLCDEECPDGCIICRSELIGIPDNSNAALLEMEIGDCVKQIGGCCEDFIPNARNLTSLTIGHNVEIIEDNAFYSCVSLSSIFIPNSVKKIGANAFRSINADITIGTGVTFIGSAAFAYADRPHSITILATTPPTLDTSGGSRFYPFDYTNNIPIYVPAESVNAYKSADVWRYYYASRIQAIPNS